MGKYHPEEVKLEAIRMYYEEGMTQRALQGFGDSGSIPRQEMDQGLSVRKAGSI
jgi:hypothetical protein